MICERLGPGIRLKFIGIQVKVSPLVFRDIGPALRGLLDRCNQQRAEQCRTILAKPAVAQVHEQNLAAVHGLADIERVFRRREHVTNERRCEELADFILHRRDCLGRGSDRSNRQTQFAKTLRTNGSDSRLTDLPAKGLRR